MSKVDNNINDATDASSAVRIVFRGMKIGDIAALEYDWLPKWSTGIVRVGKVIAKKAEMLTFQCVERPWLKTTVTLSDYITGHVVFAPLEKSEAVGLGTSADLLFLEE